MKFLTTTALLAATFAATAPTNTTLTERSGFTGAVNFYERWNCTNKCVEEGYCPFNEEFKGMTGSEPNFIGWTSGCWNVPAGAHSLGLSISNGHKFSSVGVSCDAFKAGNYVAPTKPLNVGKKQVCTVLYDASVKAVFYHWDKG